MKDEFRNPRIDGTSLSDRLASSGDGLDDAVRETRLKTGLSASWGLVRRPAVKLLVEVIVCSVQDAVEAERGGADRLELVRALDQGGLTPPLELVREVIGAVSIPVRVMVRERNNFGIRDRAELDRLCKQVHELSQMRLDGLVLGFTRDGKIDLVNTGKVLACAPELKATFHHAFEAARESVQAIGDLKSLPQIDRLLTYGGTGGWRERTMLLAAIKESAFPEITVLAGGGLGAGVALGLAGVGIREFHFGRAVREPATAEGAVRAELVSAIVRALSA